MAHTELNWLHTGSYWTQLELASFGTRYITSAPTTHRKLRLYCWNVCTNHCIAKVAALINCWAGCCLATSSKHSFFYWCGATNRRDVFNSALRSNERGVTQQLAINTRTSIAECVFQGFCVSTVPARGKHATIRFSIIPYNADVSRPVAYIFILSPLRAKYPTHFICLEFITLIITTVRPRHSSGG
jgi:hypothetical protein